MGNLKTCREVFGKKLVKDAGHVMMLDGCEK